MTIPADRATSRTAVWNRLDAPGMDACRFASGPEGWKIEGTSLFKTAGTACMLRYEVSCGKDWSSRAVSVDGWIGEESFSLRMARSGPSGWRVNGRSADHISALEDVDLGFTPATNTPAIRRLDLPLGEDVETVAAWLDTADWTVKPLRQIYRRKSETVLAYASPMHGYEAELEIDRFGVVVEYPGLWTLA
ncbi:MAG: putative glycolipid-binding domain-containing protein [Methyloligella sp. ZOD6]